MRISSSQLHAAAINTILSQQSALSNIQLQIATGRKILTPADDPAGAARVLRLSQSESVTGQYEKNSDIAESRLRQEEATLTSATDLIQRVRELTIQANNDSQSNETRPLIAAEIRQRFAELLSIANTRDANNEYLFSGFQSQIQAFTENPDGSITYNGDEGQRFVQIGISRQVATGDSGAEVFGLVGSGNGEFINRPHAFNTGSGVINSNTIFDAAAYVEGDYTAVLGQQTPVVAGALSFTDAIGTDDALEYQLSINGTSIPLATFNETDTPTLTDIETAINAQTTTTGVRAYVDAGQLYLANTLPTATPITVSETLANASDAGDAVTGLFGSALTQGAPTNDVIYDNANGYLVLDSSNAIVTSGAYTAGSNIDFNGQRLVISGTPSNGDQFSTSPNTKQDLFATLQSLTSALEAPSQNIPVVATRATLSGFTPPVSAGGENFQVTIDGINLVTSPSLPTAGDTITGAQLDADLATFIGANAGYRIVSGSFATNDLVLQKNDGTDLVVAITQNTSTTAGAVSGLLGATTNGTVANTAISATFHQTIARVLDNLDRNLGSVIDIRSRVGARLNSIDDQTNLNEASILQVRETLSGIQDLDFADAISKLEQQTTSLQAAQQSFLRIQGLSLFNFL